MLISVNRMSDKVSSAHIDRATTEDISVFINGRCQFLKLSEVEVFSYIFH